MPPVPDDAPPHSVPPASVRPRLVLGLLATLVVGVALVGWAWNGPFNGSGITDSGSSEPGPASGVAVSGTQFPSVEVRTLSGDTIDTAELLGQPLVVNVWFSTCPPCRRELPAFAAVHAEFGDVVRFVGLNPYDDASIAADFAEAYGVRYEHYLDPNGEFLAAAGVVVFPSTLFVAPDGTVAALRLGEISQATLTALVERLLA